MTRQAYGAGLRAGSRVGPGGVWAVIVLTVATLFHAATTDPDMRHIPRLSKMFDNIPPRNEWKTTYACENSKLSVSCEQGELIRVMLANYGRYSISVCNRYGITEGWNLQCVSMRSMKVVSERCDGRRRCEMMANNAVFGDPCPDTSKYAEVRYYCQPVETPKPSTSTTTQTTTRVETSTTSTTTSTTQIITTPQTTPPPQSTTSTTTTTPTPTITIPSPAPTTLGPSLIRYPSSTAPPSNVTKKPTQATMGASPQVETTLPTRPPSTRRPYSIRVCKTVRAEGVLWPTTPIGRWAKANCPGQLQGSARWLCQERGWVGAPDLSDCVSPWVETIDENIDNVLQGDASSQQVMSVLERVTGGEINSGDIKRTTMKLLPKLQEALVAEMQHARDVPIATRREKIKKFSEMFVRTTSNLLDRKQKKSWDGLPTSQMEESATSLIVAVEKSAFHVAEFIAPGDGSLVVSDNLVMEVNVRNVHGGIEPMTFPSQKVSDDWSKPSDRLYIPARSLVNAAESSGMVTVVFVMYNNLEQFMQPRQRTTFQSEDGDGDGRGHRASELSNEIIVDVPSKDQGKPQSLNTNIISAAINGRDRRISLVEPVVFTMEHLNKEQMENPVCSYWQMDSSHKRGKWSQDGCRLVTSNNTHTACECDHLTNFAVLMDVTGTKLSEGHLLSLRIITYVGCIISIICLLLSWISFVAFKNLQSDRNTIHKHLVYSLMLAEIIFLVGISQTDLQLLCSIIAGLLHFLFLVAFAWMCLEGVQLYVMLIEVFETERSRLKWYYLFGYGVPLLIVGISAAVYRHGYGTEQHCWLTTERGFIWSFVGPALVVMVINVAMLSMAIYMMCRHANRANSMKEKSRLQKLKAWIKGALVLVVLLGLTWVFGLLYLSQETVVMAYIFTILNSLQGVFIFVFHCIMNEKVQKEYRKVARRTTWLPHCIRVHYGGYHGHLSSSPNPSSTSGQNYFSRLFPGRRRHRASFASTNSSTKPFLSSRGHRLSDPNTSRDSSLYPSSINGYVYTAGNNNDPQKSPTSPGNNGFLRLAPCFENGGIVGDLSEVIDCSVVDSEAVTEYCQRNLRVSEEKRRFSSGSEEEVEPEEDAEEDRLSALSYDSIAKNRDSFVSDTDEERNSAAGSRNGDSERNLINAIVASRSGWREHSRPRKEQSPSLGNVNQGRADNPDVNLNTSTPNIKYKDSPRKEFHGQASVVQHSMPDLSYQLEGQFSFAQTDSLTYANTRKNVKHLGSDIQIRSDPHRFELSYTEL